MHGQTAFPIFLWGDGKKGLVWFTVATRLDPHLGGGVNERNVIIVQFMVTRAL